MLVTPVKGARGSQGGSSRDRGDGPALTSSKEEGQAYNHLLQEYNELSNTLHNLREELGNVNSELAIQKDRNNGLSEINKALLESLQRVKGEVGNVSELCRSIADRNESSLLGGATSPELSGRSGLLSRPDSPPAGEGSRASGTSIGSSKNERDGGATSPELSGRLGLLSRPDSPPAEEDQRESDTSRDSSTSQELSNLLWARNIPYPGAEGSGASDTSEDDLGYPLNSLSTTLSQQGMFTRVVPRREAASPAPRLRRPDREF